MLRSPPLWPSSLRWESRLPSRLSPARLAGLRAGEEVLVEHVDYGASAPFKTNFAQAALDATGGTLSANSTLEDKALDVTASVQADLAAARTRSQFRLRFTPLDGNADGQDDLATFENATNDQGTTEVPRLVVTYTP